VRGGGNKGSISSGQRKSRFLGGVGMWDGEGAHRALLSIANGFCAPRRKTRGESFPLLLIMENLDVFQSP